MALFLSPPPKSIIVAARYGASTGQASSITQPINYDVEDYDTVNAVTTGSGWKFTVPAGQDGFYEVKVVGATSALVTNMQLFKNGVFFEYIGNQTAAALIASVGSISLVAGDYIDIRYETSLTTNGSGLAVNWVSIYKLN